MSRRPDFELNAISSSSKSSLQQEIAAGYEKDPLFSRLVAHFKDPAQVPDPDIVSITHRYNYNSTSKLLYLIVNHERRLCIPRLDTLIYKIFQDAHSGPTSGHIGRDKVYLRLRGSFYWPKMQRDIYRLVQSCEHCQRNKHSNRSTQGPLRPLDVPNSPWSSVSFDFIVGLPMSDGFNAIFVVIDRLTKMGHFIPLLDTATAPDVASLYFKHVFRLHGLPKNFVSDRDPKFTSNFWKSLVISTIRRIARAMHGQKD